MTFESDQESTIRSLEADGWHRDTIRVWLRSGCHCAYCGKDMLTDADTFFYGNNIDHLVPLSRGGSEEVENRVLACRACNFLKRDFDPRLPGPADRAELIKRARAEIDRKRQVNIERLEGIHRPGLRKLSDLGR